MGKKAGWFARFFRFFSKNSEKKKASKEKQQPERSERVHLQPIQKEAFASNNTDPDHVVGYGSFRSQYRSERAATCIQTYYRGHLARKALRALRAVVRLQALVRGYYVRKQGLQAMRSMEALVRVQDRARSQRLIQLSQSKIDEEEIMKAHVVNDSNNIGKKRWDPGRRSMEEHYIMRTSQHHQHEAAFMRLGRGGHGRAPVHHQVQQQLPPPQWSSEIQKGQWGWNWLDQWMYQPWQHGLTAAPPESPYHLSDAGSETYEGRLSGRRRSAEYPTSTRYIYPDRPEGIARHSSDYPEQHALNGGTMNYEREVAMVPGYMAPTQSARAKVVRGHGFVKFGVGGAPVYQVPKSPSSKLVNPVHHLLRKDWPSGSRPDVIGVVDQTPPRGLPPGRIDFG